MCQNHEDWLHDILSAPEDVQVAVNGDYSSEHWTCEDDINSAREFVTEDFMKGPFKRLKCKKDWKFNPVIGLYFNEELGVRKPGSGRRPKHLFFDPRFLGYRIKREYLEPEKSASNFFGLKYEEEFPLT